MKRISIFLAALMMCFAALVAVPSTASAGNCTGPVCGTVIHKSPDDGYDAAFKIACGWVGPASTGYPTDFRYIHEGYSSKQYCPDMDAIYVRDGEELVCLQPQWWGGYAYTTMYDATGWYKVTDLWNYNCVNQLD